MQDYYALMVKPGHGSPKIPSHEVTDQDAHTARLVEQRQNRQRIAGDWLALDLSKHIEALTNAATQAVVETSPAPQNEEQASPNQNEAA